MVSTHETIPRPPVRFLSLYAHLPADGRWEGRGTPPARLKATPISLADASRVPGPGQDLRMSVGDPPRPFDPSVSPSTVRTIRGTSGWVGAARRPRRPGWAKAGAEARGDPPLLRAEGSTAGSSGRGFGEGHRGDSRGDRSSRALILRSLHPGKVSNYDPAYRASTGRWPIPTPSLRRRDDPRPGAQRPYLPPHGTRPRRSYEGCQPPGGLR